MGRITRKKGTFEKGYEMRWTWEVFSILKINDTYPRTYQLASYKREPIKGSFYRSELQLVDKSDDIWPIEKIVSSRRRRGQTEYFVKFQGYPDSANSWIPRQQL